MSTQETGSYGELVGLPGVRRVLVSQIIGPLASSAWSLALILLVLDYYGSPALAGLTGLLSQIGIVIVPLAGALLDSYGHKRLIVIDYAVSAIGIAIIAVLASTETLPRNTLLILVTLVGITCQFSVLGLRTALPLTVPQHLWDRGNALTFSSRALARVIAPLLVTGLASVFEPAVAVGSSAVLYVVAIICMWGYTEPTAERKETQRIWHETVEGVRYTWSNKTLRNVTGFIMLAFVIWGAFYGVIPAFVTQTLDFSTLFLGVAFAGFALADIAFAIWFGRIDTEKREWAVLMAFTAVGGIGFLIVSIGSAAAVLIGIALLGVAETPMDQAAYGLRQRLTHREMLGRVTSIAIATSFGSFAVGVAITGAIANHSPQVALVGAGVMLLIAALLPPVLLRKPS